jgi:hypothetical protein
MSTTIPVTKTVETELAAAQARIASLEAAMTPGQRDQANVAELKATVLRLGKAEVDYLAQIETLTEENATLRARDGDLEKRASFMAHDIAASQGCQPLRIDRGDGLRAIDSKGKSPRELLAQYNAISDPVERGRFYEANSEKMFEKTL